MEIALERIANMHDGELYLPNLGLTELPPLVSEGNQSTLVTLYCGGNQLTELPQLPSTLVNLYCEGNQLTSLPQLPYTLRSLRCGNNPIQYPPVDVMKKSIPYIREWMSENPLTFVKSANKV
jgi:Leucine-rich repeat (LRR) protein